MAEGDRRETFLDLSCSMTRLAEATCGEACRAVFEVCFYGVTGRSRLLLFECYSWEELVFIMDSDVLFNPLSRWSGVMIRFTPTLRGVPGARYAMTKPDLVVL